MAKFPYIFVENEGNSTLTVYLGGKPIAIPDDHPKFNEILDNVDTLEMQEVRDLLDMDKQVRKTLASFGNVQIKDGTVYYKNEAVSGVLAERMLNMLERGMDIRPWALFLENLQQNPAKHAVDELYLWMERADMPITERGNVLAYKKVKEDYTSYHTNADGSEFRNDIGTFVSMPRNKVDDNRNRTCSSGLHFCSWDYLPSYMGKRGKVVLVEVNPAHVVSIPSDYNNAKGRAEGYLIVGEIPEEECKHAFSGTYAITYDDCDYLTYEQEGEIDYSSIEDGWYSDYNDEDERAWEEKLERAYQEGYATGSQDAEFNDDYNPEEALEWSNCDVDDEDMEATYLDGYADGYYQMLNVIKLEEIEVKKERAENITKSIETVGIAATMQKFAMTDEELVEYLKG